MDNRQHQSLNESVRRVVNNEPNYAGDSVLNEEIVLEYLESYFGDDLDDASDDDIMEVFEYLFELADAINEFTGDIGGGGVGGKKPKPSPGPGGEEARAMFTKDQSDRNKGMPKPKFPPDRRTHVQRFRDDQAGKRIDRDIARLTPAEVKTELKTGSGFGERPVHQSEIDAMRAQNKRKDDAADLHRRALAASSGGRPRSLADLDRPRPTQAQQDTARATQLNRDRTAGGGVDNSPMGRGIQRRADYEADAQHRAEGPARSADARDWAAATNKKLADKANARRAADLADPKKKWDADRSDTEHRAAQSKDRDTRRATHYRDKYGWEGDKNPTQSQMTDMRHQHKLKRIAQASERQAARNSALGRSSSSRSGGNRRNYRSR